MEYFFVEDKYSIGKYISISIVFESLSKTLTICSQISPISSKEDFISDNSDSPNQHSYDYK